MDVKKEKEKILTDEEVDILQEIMNIAFGQAASDLADVIDIHVILSVPFVKILQAPELPDYIRDEIRDICNISIIEQKFLGKFRGNALMVFPSHAGKELIALFGLEENTHIDADPVETLGRETLMEVGNIMIGACIGKLAELLKDSVTYSPPRLIIENHPCDTIPDSQLAADDSAIVLKTVFSFDKGSISGFVFLVTSHESIQWLKEALRKFIEQYE
ncbi:MAG: chemotaxis protein CheC [Deferribacteres bacterium]|nr:chemotaxis protein CheC [Deferribacteres bacterium]